MKSLSKTPVTPRQAGAIARLHFGQPLASFEELSDGYFNAAYRLELDDGGIYVLKVAPPLDVRVLRYERNIMRAEVSALRLVREHTEMPVPQVHVHDTSRDILPSDYFIMDFIPGVSFWSLSEKLSETDRQAIERESAGHLRQMNEIRGESFGYFADAARFSNWPDCFDHMLRGVLQDGQDADVSLPLAYADILALARSNYDSLRSVTTPSLVHWDMWAGNIFVDPATRRVTGIIDFERALWGDPLMEVGFGAFGDNPHFRAGYGEDLLAKPQAATRKTLYNIYLYLIMVIECAYRQYETDEQENWARGLLAAALEKLTTG
jgi:aminoglycoside phosphotransferase (APT) family kinase protein